MWEKVQNLWAMPDLRNKLLFTLGMLLVFRVLANIPVPLTAEGQRRLIDLFTGRGDAALGQLLGLLDTFSGGSLQRFSIVALSIYPYITTTIQHILSSNNGTFISYRQTFPSSYPLPPHFSFSMIPYRLLPSFACGHFLKSSLSLHPP